MRKGKTKKLSYEAKMNKTSLFCYGIGIDFSYLNARYLAALTAINLIVMVGNVSANAMVMYVLIKTKQIVNMTCKVIFMLSTSDLVIGVLVQNLFTAVIYKRNCLFEAVYRFASIFVAHVSFYAVAIIGIDRYIRIKYFANFKTIWTRKVVLTLMCIGVLLAFLLAVTAELCLILLTLQMAFTVYVAVDGTFVVVLIFLQIKTIKASNNVHGNSTVSAAEETNKKITKLSLRIMLMLCMFLTPYIVFTDLVRAVIPSQLSYNNRSVLEFVYCLTLIFIYANSLANALLFLLTNVKAKRFFRDLTKRLSR